MFLVDDFFDDIIGTFSQSWRSPFQSVFFAGFFYWAKKSESAIIKVLLQGKSSETEECQVIETTIHTDKDWIKNLDPKELEYYQKNQISIEVLEDRRVHCTACYEQGNHKQKGFFVRHPTLGVPICKACKSYYFEGSWRKDEEGKFEYCGWCAQGGDLLCCSKSSCPNAFCLKCIKHNLGRKSVTKIEETEKWRLLKSCFLCF